MSSERRMRGKRLAAAAFAASLLGIAVPFAQGTAATLRGRVVDAEGTGLPSVPVLVLGSVRGAPVSRTALTDIEGNFKFNLLSPETGYRLAIDYPGFAPMEVGPIDLDPGKTTVQDVTLRSKEELTQRVEVTAHGSIVDTESTKTSTTFNVEYIEGLPIIGRNYQDILTLTPGVTDTDGDGNPNVQGARATGLQYRLDGGNITDPASGTFGQNLNIEVIEEIEVITAGASAEYGRADGGFANIITKSGGNEFEGSFKMFWRGRFLDGNGALENNDTTFTFNRVQPEIRRVSPYLTLGGALRKDRLWYFASWQQNEFADPINLAGYDLVRRTRGHNGFLKLTLQAGVDNRVSVQYNDDPSTLWGGFLTFGTDPDSDAAQLKAGRTPQLRWTSILSPSLLLETLLTHFESGYGIDPVSGDWHRIDVQTSIYRQTNGDIRKAHFPVKECSVNGRLQGFFPNCDPAWGKPTIYRHDLRASTTMGPFPFKSDDARVRNSIKSDLSLTIEDAWGEHQIRSGLEFADEKFADMPVANPILYADYRACRGCATPTQQPVANSVEGTYLLVDFAPRLVPQRVSGFNSSAYVNEIWKPVPNLTLQAGVRIDKEDIDTSGYEEFDPRAEKRKMNAIVADLCAEADRSRQAGLPSSWSTTCDPASGFKPGMEPVALAFTLLPDAPESVRRLDRDEDGVFDDSWDGPAWREPLTKYVDREPEYFEITNLNLAPRFSVSWDPWSDGKTKLFGTWGRFHDRLFLNTVRHEMGPDVFNYTFRPDPDTFQFEPGMFSTGETQASIFQVDRHLGTPHTDAVTAGVEREIAPEWSVRLTLTQKLSADLLQDVDLNHVLCTQHDEEFGIDPRSVCALYTDSKGRTHLSDDLFGQVGTRWPNGAPDLYLVSPTFNQVFRIGNYNRSKYQSVTLEADRRLHRNWQMTGSYTWSRVVGNAEEFLSLLGDDAATTDDERGFLDYDQRHRAVVYAVAHLPRDVEFGGTVFWEGGTPFSLLREVIEEDNHGNSSTRTFFPTGRRNDQRNGNQWSVDVEATKRFRLGGAAAAAQITVTNLLNHDDLTLSALNRASEGPSLRPGPRGLRRFGRIWEIGMSVHF